MRAPTLSALALLPILATHNLAQADGNGGLLPSVRSRVTRLHDLRPPGMPTDADLEAAGAQIGEIRIELRAIFDTHDPQENTRLFRLANHLHITTRESTIRAQLLIRPGDLYRGRLLEESERLLRDTRYLQDASIVPVAWHDGVVDVAVVTQDVWTLNPGFSFSRTGGENSSGFEIEEQNLLGRGTRLSLGYEDSVDRTSTLLRYEDRQLGHTWWSLKTAYSDNSDGAGARVELERPFYALDTRWATGFAVRSDERIDAIYDLGRISDEFRTRERFASTYYGWSRGLRDGWARRITAGVTYHEHEFESVIGETGLTRTVPGDRKLVYPWLGYEALRDEFQKTRNRDQIEKTEDHLLGTRVTARLGFASPAFGSDRDALMLSARFSRGLLPSERQTVLLAGSLAGRLEGGDAADLVFGASARYYLRQSPHRLFFLSLSSDIASNPDADHQLLLGGDNGLRGYPLRYQAGEGRWLFTAEQRFFTSWYPFRLFNVGGALFFDAGRTWGDNPAATRSRGLLRDVGLGLRLGNTRSALGNMLHIDIAMPLDGDSSIDSVQLLIETQSSF